MQYSDPFQKAIDFVLRWEGGHVNDPDDPGGETAFGISKAAYPTEDIAGMTMERAIMLYHDDYWILGGCHLLPVPLDLLVFDFAVNAGVYRAVSLFQETLNSMGFPLKIDGKLGKNTATAARNADQYPLAQKYLWRRVQFYANQPQKQRVKYLAGWVSRTFALSTKVM